jgi:hypothetical protein
MRASRLLTIPAGMVDAIAVVALGAISVAACGSDPPFSLRFKLTSGTTEQCIGDTGVPAQSCADVTMLCDGVVQIVVAPPNDLTAPFTSVCKPLSGKTVCAIAGVDLPRPAMPVADQRLLVTMAVYPAYRIPLDPISGELHCPPPFAFSADGFPTTIQPICDDTISDPNDPMYCWPIPAIGGTAYYSPGDPETVVDLGCADLRQLTDRTTCLGQNVVAVTATVDDFDSEVPVAPSTADRLAVAVGEPMALTSTEWALDTANERPLARTVLQPVPGWGANVDLMFTSTACLAVLEDDAQATTALTCIPVAPDQKTIDITGIRLAKTTLNQVLAAIGAPTFPSSGLVVGIVLDYLGNPLPNMAVTPSDPQVIVDYLSADRSTIIAGGTSSTGIFITKDARAVFGTTFSARGGPLQIATGIGGLVDGKVDVVVLQFTQPIGN